MEEGRPAVTNEIRNHRNSDTVEVPRLTPLVIAGLLILVGCSSGGGGGEVRYVQDGHFVRDMSAEHTGIARQQYKRVGKDPGAVASKSWNVLYCPRDGSKGDLGDYGCNCEGSVGNCVHAWDSTPFGGFESTRLYAGPDPKSSVIWHEEAHATIASWIDNPSEVTSHPTGHPSWVTVGGARYSVKRDLLPGIRWPLIFRASAYGLNPKAGKYEWEAEGCAYDPSGLQSENIEQ